MREKHEIVYVKAARNSVCLQPQVKLSDVMSVECADPAICAGIKNMTLYSFQGQKSVFHLKGDRTHYAGISGGGSGQLW